jgi:hypothetical protein
MKGRLNQYLYVARGQPYYFEVDFEAETKSEVISCTYNKTI